MNFFAKIEHFINLLLLKFAELIWRIIPTPLKHAWEKLTNKFSYYFDKIKQLPSKLKVLTPIFVGRVKIILQTLDIKSILIESYKKAKIQATGKSTDKFHELKTLFLTPAIIIAKWIQGLTPTQSVLLLAFTGLSILSTISIGLKGKRIVDAHTSTSRAPASAEEVEYDRPTYYKQQHRQFQVTNFRLPVYVAELNQLRSVDIDFSATMSNRNVRSYLEKYEFQLRDHLILQIEPSIASFPLEEEGKEIIREKLLLEINQFLKLQNVQGEVTEIEITYILAN